jgi:protein-S-isoprenylcysteine O-methyltransferase
MNYFPILGVVWGLGEMVILLARRSKSGDMKMDRGTLKLISFVTIAGVILSVVMAYHFPVVKFGHSPLLLGAATCLIVAGIVLRWYSIYYLGRFFCPQVVITTDHQLIDSGPYRLVRHPCYTGVMMCVLGFGLSMQNLGSLLILAVSLSCVLLRRMQVEEEALVKAFGQKYLDYMKRTKRLIPFVY